MRIEILNDDGELVNWIIASEEFAEEHFPGMWRVAEVQSMPLPTVAQSVTPKQAHQALVLSGLYDAVAPAIAAIADPVQRQLAQIEWDKANEFRRDSPLLNTLAAELGLSASDLDNLFTLAATL